MLLEQDIRAQSLTPAKLRELSELKFFAGADLEAIEGLLRACKLRDLQSEEVLLRAGDPAGSVYVVVLGRLQVHIESLDSTPIAVLERGDSIGEMSIIDQRPASAFVVAAEYARLLVIEPQIFWGLIDSSHAIARNLLITLAARLRNNNAAVLEGERKQHEFRRSGLVDDLTGVHNRRWLNEMLERQLSRAASSRRPLSLLMLDVDHFKRFNDSFGHLQGDCALRAVARALTLHVRPTDQVARFGGEEFCVVLSDTDLAGALIVAERLREAVAETIVLGNDQRPLPSVTISVGAAQAQAEASGQDLLYAADAALYRAKRTRNCVAQ